MKKKKHVDIDDMPAGDNIDWMLCKKLFSDASRNEMWFIRDSKGRHQYFGPKYSTSYEEALGALSIYCSQHKDLIKAYSIREQFGDDNDPYRCTAEVQLNKPQFMWVRSWAPTVPLAIVRMLLKAPVK